MITVTLNRTEFEYDIHSLIKAFSRRKMWSFTIQKEAHADEKNVACTNHSAEQEEAGSSHFRLIMRMTEFPSPGMTRRMVGAAHLCGGFFQSYRDKECIEGTSVPPA